MSVVFNLPKLYEEKENLKVDNSIPENKKVMANDMNTIKKLLENSCFLDPNSSSDKLIDYNMRTLNPIIERYEKLKYNLVTDGPAVKTGRQIDGKNEWVVKKSFTGVAADTSKRLPMNLPTSTKAHAFNVEITHPTGDGVLVKDGWYMDSTNIFSAHGYKNGDIQVITGAGGNWATSDMKYYVTVYFTYSANEPEDPELPDDTEDIKNYVKFNDYATSIKSGVVKLGNGFNLDSNGKSKCDTNTYDQYTNLSDDTFISKGTLVNVLANEIGSISTALNSINGEVV